MTLATEQIHSLESLGYKREESMFLHLVATHSGYFTHRQFLSFAETKPGYFSHDLIRKLLEKKHADFQTFRSGARVYHLFGRQVYQALGKDNLRTRRRHGLEYIQTRLVTLDFILQYPIYDYLETEPEKVAFFEGRLGIDRKILPVKHYRSSRSKEVTPRYFVDRFPIFVSEANSSSPMVTLSYVDPGSLTLLGFKTHLLAYAELLRSLPRFQFWFIAPTEKFFWAAEDEFHNTILDRHPRGSAADLLKYFRIRQAWDAQKPVPSADVLFLREAKTRYSGTAFDALYEDWRSGKIQSGDISSRLNRPEKAPVGSFHTETCGASLGIFSKPNRRSTESCIPQKPNKDQQLSDEVSR
jgi:hypothetical protein